MTRAPDLRLEVSGVLAADDEKNRHSTIGDPPKSNYLQAIVGYAVQVNAIRVRGLHFNDDGPVMSQPQTIVAAMSRDTTISTIFRLEAETSPDLVNWLYRLSCG